jgi:uncharacterized protein YbjT (DUF2867 family)
MPVVVVQPVSALGVAEALADAVERGPGSSGRLPDLAGPEVLRLPDMARAVLRARGERAIIVPRAAAWCRQSLHAPAVPFVQ